MGGGGGEKGTKKFLQKKKKEGWGGGGGGGYSMHSNLVNKENEENKLVFHFYDIFIDLHTRYKIFH